MLEMAARDDMSLTMKQSNALAAMAQLLAEFLPYSGAFEASGQITFRTIARKHGVVGFWQKMSKRQGIANLMEGILSESRGAFEPFLLDVVREGLRYREKDGRPITRKEIETLNGLVLEVGFKFPDLWDADFLNALQVGAADRARAHIAEERAREKVEATSRSAGLQRMEALRQSFYALSMNEDRQAAGLALEKLLNQLFALEGLAPRSAFRIVGEQIDGSFALDSEIYLLEAKWEKKPVSEADLLVFHGKISGKSHITRGVFIALNGVSSQAQDSITRGKQANFFILDGHDLSAVLEGRFRLDDLLRAKLRRLAEEGAIYVPCTNL